ncbi:DUF6296 family protein [Kitasatospora sp. NPDC008115]|uniref:DUF6296 family protein n=1 Tax=Kitasatospora sp. NPDC008115 TaxID=3364022 RepID=UPI0036E9CA36
MPVHQRYAVTLPGRPGAHERPTVLPVHLSDGIAPGGGQADGTGQWRLRIEGEVATVLSAPADYDGRLPCLEAVPMP